MAKTKTLNGVLLVLTLLLHTIVSDGVQTSINVDFAGTYLNQNTNLLKRIQKTASVQYIYRLASNDIWSQFPDMAINFKLNFDQPVYIKYNLIGISENAWYFCTRLLIAGKEDITFRSITGNAYHFSNYGAE